MNVKEFYDYIVSKMTPEEALMKLLGGQIETYEKIKENKPLKEGETSVNPVYIIAAAAMDMGWNFSIEKNVENIEGLVVGTKDYMKRLFKEKAA